MNFRGEKKRKDCLIFLVLKSFILEDLIGKENNGGKFFMCQIFYFGRVPAQSFCSTPKPALISELGIGKTKSEIL